MNRLQTSYGFCSVKLNAWFPVLLRIVIFGDSYHSPTSGILKTSANIASQTFQIADDHDMMVRIGIISVLKVVDGRPFI